MAHTIRVIFKVTDVPQALSKCSRLLLLAVFLQLGEEDFSPQGAVGPQVGRLMPAKAQGAGNDVDPTSCPGA